MFFGQNNNSTKRKYKFYGLCVGNPASGLLQNGCKLENDNDVRIFQNFFDVVLFFLSSLVTGQSFMSILSLVLELWQFPFIRDWPEIQKSEIPPTEFCRTSRDWDELRIPNLTWASLVKCYWLLQNARVIAFTVSELLRQYQQGEGEKLPPHPPPPRIGPSLLIVIWFLWAIGFAL